MIVRLKEMIERCMRRARRGECATCDHREACVAAKWNRNLAFAGPASPPAEVMDRASAAGNPFLAFLGELAGAVQRRIERPRPSFRREVEARLEPLLAAGDVGIERIARELGCSRQTLYRRLRAEGITFEQVLDDLRHRLALRYLRREGLGVKQAAYRLGFSDPAAFSRAFKRWTGRSPSELRSPG